MKLHLSSVTLFMLAVTFFIHIPLNRIHAQNVTEPPIPVYIVCPFHEDSLRAAKNDSALIQNPILIQVRQKYDTLQLQIQKSTAENAAHFTWLYSLIAVLSAMNIILLLLTARIRKILAHFITSSNTSNTG